MNALLTETLDEKGTLFSCQPTDDNPAMIFYRPHETWTARADWRTELPKGESITGTDSKSWLDMFNQYILTSLIAISLSDSYITVSTSTDYVRIYTLFGTPFRVYRQKSQAVTCASWRDYVLTIGNGPVGSDGTTKLTYTVENVRRDEVYQNEDTVALTADSELQSVFFSDNGVCDANWPQSS